MRVRLLGTGSADGWPNAFCECASCRSAHQSGQWRVPTSALVDGKLLLDCGPETPRAALRHDDGLRGVTHVLVTHDHPDHSAPMALLSRAWAGRTEPITVVGPQTVIATWCQWVGPDDPVRWRAVLPGDAVDADGYAVRVLAAAHGDEEAVVYDVTGPTGERLLYATDTGPLPEHTVAATADAAYDLVLMEAAFGDRRGPGAPASDVHLDLSTFADQMVRLREVRALTRHSRVVAVHLSHHSPPDLRPRLGAWGVQVVDDGQAFDLDRTELRAAVMADAVTGPPPDERRRTLVLGGVRSGKSTAAERLFAADAEVTYVATGAVPDGDDAEWAERVAHHRARRPQHWTTLETTDLEAVLREASGPLLVDCLGTWLTAVLQRCGAWDDAPGWRRAVDQHVDALVEAWHGVQHPVVAVSNEVGAGVVPAAWSGRVFRDELGRLNTRLAAASERVLLVVAGRTLDVTALEALGAAAGSTAAAEELAPTASSTAPTPPPTAAPTRAVSGPAAVPVPDVETTAVLDAVPPLGAAPAGAHRVLDLTAHDASVDQLGERGGDGPGPWEQDTA